MPARIEVELDIFSGMPNPTWTLTDTEADSFTKQLAAASPTAAAELHGNLGYRGFIVQMTRGADTQAIRVQNGTIHISQAAASVYARDEDRKLEQWLLDTARPYIKDELFQMAKRELR